MQDVCNDGSSVSRMYVMMGPLSLGCNDGSSVSRMYVMMGPLCAGCM